MLSFAVAAALALPASLASLASLAFLGPGTARAGDVLIDEISVTAPGEETSTPPPATRRFDGPDLERLAIDDLADLARHAPGFYLGQLGGTPLLSLRGLGTEDISPGAQSAVELVVDGVSLARPHGAALAFFDLEAATLARGPQGTRGGGQAPAGAVRIETRKPHGEFESSLELRTGSLNERGMLGVLNLPLSERIWFRTSLLGSQRDGYSRNAHSAPEATDAFDVDDFGLRSWLRLVPNENAELLLGFHLYTQGGAGPAAELLPHDSPDVCPFGIPGLGGQRSRLPRWAHCVPGFTASDDGNLARPNRSYRNTPSRRDDKYWGGVSKLRLSLGSARRGFDGRGAGELLIRSAFDSMELGGDADGTEIDFLATSLSDRVRQQTHELQWSLRPTPSVRGKLSFYYRREDGSAHSSVRITHLSPLPREIPARQSTVNLSSGVAAAIDWSPVDDVELSAGLRYGHWDRETRLLRRGGGSDLASAGAVNTDCEGAADRRLLELKQPPATCRVRTRRVTGSLRAIWKPRPASRLYAEVASGVRAAGFSAWTPGEQLPETLWSFSAGAEHTLWQDRAILSLDAFWYRYHDYQLVVWDDLALRAENAPQATLRGVELGLELAPTGGLRIRAQGAWLDARLDEFASVDPADLGRNARCRQRELNGLGCQRDDYSGNQLPRAPTLSASLHVEQRFELGPLGALTPSAHFSWRDDSYFRAFNRPFDRQDAHHRTDLAVSWIGVGERWHARLALENLEDQPTLQNVFVGSARLGQPAPRFAWYGPPRLLRFRAGFRY